MERKEPPQNLSVFATNYPCGGLVGVEAYSAGGGGPIGGLDGFVETSWCCVVYLHCHCNVVWLLSDQYSIDEELNGGTKEHKSLFLSPRCLWISIFRISMMDVGCIKLKDWMHFVQNPTAKPLVRWGREMGLFYGTFYRSTTFPAISLSPPEFTEP
jgi:hypothetical protein